MSLLDNFKIDVQEENEVISSLKLLIDEKNIESKTILTNKQVVALTLMNWAGQVYKIDFLNDFINRFIRFRISGDKGRGRKDIIEIAKSIAKIESEKLKDEGINKYI